MNSPTGGPPHLRPAMVEHMEKWAGRDRFFLGRDGQPMRGNAIYQAFVRAREKVSVEITFTICDTPDRRWRRVQGRLSRI